MSFFRRAKPEPTNRLSDVTTVDQLVAQHFQKMGISTGAGNPWPKRAMWIVGGMAMFAVLDVANGVLLKAYMDMADELLPGLKDDLTNLPSTPPEKTLKQLPLKFVLTVGVAAAFAAPWSALRTFRFLRKNFAGTPPFRQALTDSLIRPYLQHMMKRSVAVSSAFAAVDAVSHAGFGYFDIPKENRTPLQSACLFALQAVPFASIIIVAAIQPYSILPAFVGQMGSDMMVNDPEQNAAASAAWDKIMTRIREQQERVRQQQEEMMREQRERSMQVAAAAAAEPQQQDRPS